MIHGMIRALALGAALLVSAPAMAQALPGQLAPAFALTDLAGKPVRLADFRGRYVVLEWTNPSCPFVQKHYVSGNLQALQKRYTAGGVAWLVVNSTAANHSEFLQAAQQAAWLDKQGAAPTATMLDPDGKVGRAYGARTTPHMYVIDPNGKLIYAGAIDDKRSANPADVKTAKNYVAQVLDEARAGKPVSTASTPAYGCSVKYAD
ncbi:MAG: thioredoxin family protein [Betaproteobacteria bacterium]|nr:MAG: thioredoxin family protein [Betaproteobacteria bacterium]